MPPVRVPAISRKTDQAEGCLRIVLAVRATMSLPSERVSGIMCKELLGFWRAVVGHAWRQGDCEDV